MAEAHVAVHLGNDQLIWLQFDVGFGFDRYFQHVELCSGGIKNAMKWFYEQNRNIMDPSVIVMNALKLAGTIKVSVYPHFESLSSNFEDPAWKSYVKDGKNYSLMFPEGFACYFDAKTATWYNNWDTPVKTIWLHA
jgi:hypothetical protein